MKSMTVEVSVRDWVKSPLSYVLFLAIYKFFKSTNRNIYSEILSEFIHMGELEEKKKDKEIYQLITSLYSSTS